MIVFNQKVMIAAKTNATILLTAKNIFKNYMWSWGCANVSRKKIDSNHREDENYSLRHENIYILY